MKQVILFIIVHGICTYTNAQSIRKDYREFTRQEMSDYRNALNILRNNGIWMNSANAHSTHFNTNVHSSCSTCTGEQFLPWHRFFLLEMEWYIRNSSNSSGYLSIPYWDWRVDRSSTSSTHWSRQFLSLSNLSGFTQSPTTLTRNITNTSGTNLPTTSNINTNLGLSTFWIAANSSNSNSPDFSHRLENFHNNVHGWVAGSMNSGTSPRDPVFYLHHNMVDFLWQVWEDNNSGLQSTFTNGNTGIEHYTSPEYPFTVVMNTLRDSRSIPNPAINTFYSRNNDVWFAYNTKVILDGTNGNAFICSDISSPYVYRYTAAKTTGGSAVEGSIFVGDIKRDASDNVIADNKGGFQINSGVSVYFKAGKDISFKPGYWAKSGSLVSARIISTPNAELISSSNNLGSQLNRNSSLIAEN